MSLEPLPEQLGKGRLRKIGVVQPGEANCEFLVLERSLQERWREILLFLSGVMGRGGMASN